MCICSNSNYNAVSGTISSQLAQLTTLVSLNLGDNLVSGQIPHQMSNLSALTALNLCNNELGGTVPTELGPMYSQLGFVYLYSNQLSGSVPGSTSSKKTCTQQPSSLYSKNNKAYMSSSTRGAVSNDSQTQDAALRALYDSTNGVN